MTTLLYWIRKGDLFGQGAYGWANSLGEGGGNEDIDGDGGYVDDDDDDGREDVTILDP